MPPALATRASPLCYPPDGSRLAQCRACPNVDACEDRGQLAIVAYQVHEELTVDGKPVTLDAADSSTWVRRNGRWLCALHTEAIAGDPFGRDGQQIT
jgi:hypothetical protein